MVKWTADPDDKYDHRHCDMCEHPFHEIMYCEDCNFHLCDECSKIDHPCEWLQICEEKKGSDKWNDMECNGIIRHVKL